MDTIIAMGSMALLFVLFGVIKYRGCTGHCAGCTGACGRHTDIHTETHTEGDHDVG